jgi:hypothetical protein
MIRHGMEYPLGRWKMATIEQAKEALQAAKDFQEEADQILQPKMTQQDIERIVAACGYAFSIEERVTGRGDGTTHTYAKARTRGSAKKRTTRSLGKLDTVMALDQDELVKLIEDKFKDVK